MAELMDEVLPSAVGREETLQAGPGVTLHVEHFPAQGETRLVVVALHGYAAHLGNYRHVAATLAKAGIATTYFDCRGHGRSTGPRGHCRRFEQYIDDLGLVVAGARAAHPGLPWALLGHSHGALIAVEAVLRGRLRPDRLVLAAPHLGLRMKVPAWKRLLAPLLSLVWPGLALASGLRAEEVTRNPAAIERHRTDPLIHHVATSRWFIESRRAQAHARGAAATLAIPTFLLVAGADRIVDNDAIAAFAAATPAVLTVRRYEGLYHELFVEPEWQQVVADISHWLAGSPGARPDPREAKDDSPAILEPSP
jgi:alpha-beta hydrolase superfamily lysophospholipase